MKTFDIIDLSRAFRKTLANNSAHDHHLVDGKFIGLSVREPRYDEPLLYIFSLSLIQ